MKSNWKSGSLFLGVASCFVLLSPSWDVHAQVAVAGWAEGRAKG